MSQFFPTRRSFLQSAAALAGVAAWGCAREPREDPYRLTKPPVPGTEGWRTGEERWVSTACGQCPAGCGIRVRVVEGRVVKIAGQPSCPINRGGIGPRGLSGPQLLYDPDRIRQPLRREGGRDSGSLRPIEWEEAIGLLASRLKRLRKQDDAHRLAIVCGRPRGVMRDLWSRFARVYGTPNLFDGITSTDAAVAAAMFAMQGVDEQPAYDWRNSRYILSLGSNLLGSSCQLISFSRAESQLRRGRRDVRPTFVHVGPSLSRTARNADEWIPIRPGTEAAFALGLAHILVRDGTYDQEFVREHAFGFESWEDAEGRRRPGFRELLLRYTPGFVSGVCEIDPRQLAWVAEDLERERPAFAVTGEEATAHARGLYTAMAVHALNALLGAIDRPGGVLVQRPAPLAAWPDVPLDTASQQAKIWPRLDGADGVRYPCRRSCLEALPGAIASATPYAVDTLLLYYSNPLYSKPGQSAWRAALKQVPFIVSFSPFLDETVDEAADLVLPDHTYLERWEDAASAPSEGPPVFGLRQPVVPPLHDTRSTGDVLIQTARKIGEAVGDAMPWKSFESALKKRVFGIYKIRRGTIVEKKGSRFLKRLYTEGCWSEHEYPYEDWAAVLRTPSGRFEFASKRIDRWLAAGHHDSRSPAGELLATYKLPQARAEPCLPHYSPVHWSGERNQYPFMLLPYTPATYAEGSGANLPWLQELVVYNGRPMWTTEVQIHPDTAAQIGVADGDVVEVRSAHGTIEGTAHVDAGLWPGVVRIPRGGGHTAFGRWARGRGGNVNRLLPGGLDLVGGTPVLLGTRVALWRKRG